MTSTTRTLEMASKVIVRGIEKAPPVEFPDVYATVHAFLAYDAPLPDYLEEILLPVLEVLNG